MTIRYKILVNDADKELLPYLEEEYCCYGSVGQKFASSERVGGGFRTTRRFTYGRFNGLHLDLSAHTPYGQGTTADHRSQYEMMFQELGIFKWLGTIPDTGTGQHNKGAWYHVTRDEHGHIDSFTFSKDCPMYLVVAATGIWRMFANAPNLWLTYRALTRKGISAHAAFAGALNVDSSSMGVGTDLMNHKFRVCHYQTHMPWGSRVVDVRATSRLMHLTHEDFKSLKSMYDEQKETDSLSYNGRDNWFFGTKMVPPHPGMRAARMDPEMNYMTHDMWRGQVVEVATEAHRWSSAVVKGSTLIDWCRTLDKEAKLLKGCDLQLTRAATRALINEQKKKAPPQASSRDPWGRPMPYATGTWR